MIYFVSGIDTGVGKTVATAKMLGWLRARGSRASAMKLVQTGLRDEAGDREEYRRISGVQDLPDCPACFSYPSSPDLAAVLEGRSVDPVALVRTVERESVNWDVLLVEGAGGLMVPLTEEMTVLDMLEASGWPVVLVTSARLGGINHTLLSLEVLARRGIPLAGLVFNEVPAVDDCMREHALGTFRRGLVRYGFPDQLATLPEGGLTVLPDFSVLFR